MQLDELIGCCGIDTLSGFGKSESVANIKKQLDNSKSDLREVLRGAVEEGASSISGERMIVATVDVKNQAATRRSLISAGFEPANSFVNASTGNKIELLTIVISERLSKKDIAELF